MTALLPAVSGCSAMDSVVDLFGPKPNQTLVDLAASAEADSQALTASDMNLAQLRGDQARALYDEITRLCGTKPDGSTPDSCLRSKMKPSPPKNSSAASSATSSPASSPTDSSTTPSAADSPAAADQPTGNQGSAHAAEAALSELLTEAPQAPEESRVLLAEQAVALAAALPVTEPGTSGAQKNTTPALPAFSGKHADSPAASQARKLLEWEYAQVYGLDFARAYADPSQNSAIDADILAAERRIDALREALAPTGNVPVSAASYQPVGLDLPTDPDSAAKYVTALNSREKDRWIGAAAHAMSMKKSEYNPEWVEWIVRIAGHTRSATTP